MTAVNLYNFIKYTLLRPVISFFSFYGYYIFFFKKWEKTYDDKRLKDGISVYIPCKDEESHITHSLESLLEIADQFILIDNGSTDKTLRLLHEFAAKHNDKAHIEVHSKPQALLVELVQFALSRVQYRWLLKWDGDMIAVRDSFVVLKPKLKRIFRPTAFILPRLNLDGDAGHVIRFSRPIDAGEPFLRTYNHRFLFREEFGRLEHAVIPIYYKLKKEKVIYSVHLSNVRPPARIMYRHCYLDWRQTVNTAREEIRLRYQSFPVFRHDWLIHNFKTIDDAALTFRSGRLLASMLQKLNTRELAIPPWYLNGLPLHLKRFEVVYKDERPWLVRDNADEAMRDYEPTDEDLSYNPDYRLFHTDEIRLAFTR